MNFLTAHKLVKSFKTGPDLEFRLVMSGEAENLHIFLRAYAATRGFLCQSQVIPFNTLQQFIRQNSVDDVKNIFIIFPWDLLPALDWRTGFTEDEFFLENSLESILQTQKLLERIPDKKLIYIHAPTPPVAINCNVNDTLRAHLMSVAFKLGAHVCTEEAFSLSHYLTHGTPISSNHASMISKTVIELALNVGKQPCKILATDLDNVMWRGVIGEDGLDNIHYGPTGPGYRHFLYQSYLKRLKSQGIVLVAVSRNDSELANLPFEKGSMTLKKDDFISIIASYNAKSTQLAQVAGELGLSLDSIVFVDDNPLEIAEVSEQLAAVNCLLFPEKDTGLPEFFLKLSSFFDRDKVSTEDRQRTELYRTRLKSMAPSSAQGSDLTEFLAKLEMKLAIRQRRKDDFDRALQLINKTNQFNLNGIRLEESDVTDVLDAGGKLFTAELTDKNGSHGEILACLIDNEGKVIAYVLSCRVFQRKVEFAFLVWLTEQKIYDSLSFKFAPTNRNIPIQNFFNDKAFDNDPDALPLVHPETFIDHHQESCHLFEITADTGDGQ